MSAENSKFNNSKPIPQWLQITFGLAVAAGVAGIGIWAAQKDIWPTTVAKDKCGVRIRDNKVINKDGACFEPDWYWLRPYFDRMFEVSANTIILDTEAGGRRNTKDQNDLAVELRFHYRNNLKSGNVAYHIDDMARDDGKSLLKTLIGQAVDSAAGYSMAIDTMKDPRSFLFTLADNLQWRLDQNNVAIEVDAIEVNVMKVGGLRTPVQLRLKLSEDGKTWNIQNITGPTAAQSVGANLSPTASSPR